MKTVKYIFVAMAASLILIGCGGGGGIDVGIGGSSTLEVVNSSTSTSDICNVYSEPASSSTWGTDDLSGTIAPGYYQDFTSDLCDENWDLKIVFCDGYTDYVMGYYRACGATRAFTFQNW